MFYYSSVPSFCLAAAVLVIAEGAEQPLHQHRHRAHQSTVRPQLKYAQIIVIDFDYDTFLYEKFVRTINVKTIC